MKLIICIVLIFSASLVGASHDTVDKLITEYQPSTLTYDQQKDEFLWFEKVAKVGSFVLFRKKDTPTQL